MSVKSKKIMVRVSEEEKNLIETNAKLYHMSASSYIRQRILEDPSSYTPPYKVEILQELMLLSDEIEMIEDEQLKKSIRKRTLKLWHYLNM